MRITHLIIGLALMPLSSNALTINTNFIDQGNTLVTFGSAESTPASAVGGGNIQAIVRTAADYWESAYSDDHVLNIDYGWFLRNGPATATHRLVSQGGVPHRETAAAIAFDTDRIWFLDPTPWESSEFSSFNSYSSNGINVGREYTGGIGAASNRDLLSTAIHEIGHALGLSSSNSAFRAELGFFNTPGVTRKLEIDSPLPFSGSVISVDDNTAHLDNATYPHALLRSSRGNGVRRFASEADILANAQISQFTGVNLNPVLIPEPSSLLLSVFSLCGLLFSRRRKL